MFCTSCGKQIDKDDLFCINCGEKNIELQEEYTEEKETIEVEEINNVDEEKATSKLQGKFEEQVSKAQNGIGKVKTKTEFIREKSKLTSIINDAQVKKAKVLAELGLLAYEKIRLGEINDEDLNTISKSILGFDYIIYDNSKKIEELDMISQNITCTCGTVVSEGGKFCTECGKKVEIEVKDKEYTTCGHCEAKIEKNSNFCPCCGNRM